MRECVYVCVCVIGPTRPLTSEHNKHLKNNTESVSLVPCVYGALHWYYWRCWGPKSRPVRIFPFSPPKLCQRIVCSHRSLMFLFPVLICALVAGGAFIPATVTYIILFSPNITFQSFFFLLDQEISHISCWKRKIKAHYAESCFQVCDISLIFDVVFTIGSQKAAFSIRNTLRTSRKSEGSFFSPFYSIEFVLALISPLPADVRLNNNVFFSIRMTGLGTMWTRLPVLLLCVLEQKMDRHFL